MEAATDKILVTLPDGTPLELPAGATGADAAAATGMSRRLKRSSASMCFRIAFSIFGRSSALIVTSGGNSKS